MRCSFAGLCKLLLRKDFKMYYDIDQLNSIPILEVADALGIERQGRKLIRCFIHDDRSPSFSFDSSSNMWHCFGCGAGGDVIKLVERYREVGFTEACQWLTHSFQRKNTSGGRYRPKVMKPLQKAEISIDSDLYREIVEMLTLSEKARYYLTDDRAIHADILNENLVKSIEDIDVFYKHLQYQYSPERLISAGFMHQNEQQELRQTWYSSGIVFPYINSGGNIVNLQMRPYDSNRSKSKYIFLKGIPTCMYNERILKTLSNNAALYLCEGVMDTLSLLQAKKNCVGIPGVGAFKDEWVDEIGRFSIYILFDNDEPGQKGAGTLCARLKNSGVSTYLCHVQKKWKDVNDMLIAERKEE